MAERAYMEGNKKNLFNDNREDQKRVSKYQNC
jgi:hypothetical protein